MLVADHYRYPLRRNGCQSEISWFTLLTPKSQQHVDTHDAAPTQFGEPLVGSTFALASVDAAEIAHGSASSSTAS